MTGNDAPRTVVVLNPMSGGGNNNEDVSRRAGLEGYAVERTQEAGDGVRLAREAAERGASTIVAAGGDGTINEVLRGIDEADAFDRVTLGVVPTGTGNNFAGNVGITDIEHGFRVLAEGERRRIDLGRANGALFLNSCVGGLTAESSEDTSPELKSRLGVLAYVVTTLREYAEFDPPRLAVEVHEEGSTNHPSQAQGDSEARSAWEGNPIVVFAGNARRIAPVGDSQANVEDGLLDVTIIEDVSALDLVSGAVDGLVGDAASGMFDGESEFVTHMLAPALEISVEEPGQTWFSLDGEMVQHRTLSLRTHPDTVEVAVGEGYAPDPEPR